jgi:glycosyltransferase involved in cell wall biosynthesis
MNDLNRIAFIGNSLPRHCGIATFTTDLQQAIAALRPELDSAIVAMNDHGQSYDYPATVRCVVRDDKIEDYAEAADFLNAGRFDIVSLQHEFGIFGGESGDYLLALLSRLTVPVVTTLHTVLSHPTPIQHTVLDRVIAASSRVVVMAEKGRSLLRTIYDVPAEKIEVLPHGIPDFAFVEPDAAKARFGHAGRTVILTFGLLSPSKGIEFMIDAMPSILESRPETVYVVLGATHPNLVREQGEAYRESLQARVCELGIEGSVVFLDQFVDQATLLEFISMCDVYVTPYLNETQMTSGTLAYAIGLGKAVVSTPYWHAQELLAEGRGILVPFADAGALGGEIAALLTDDCRRQAMRRRAYAVSRSMIWERTAERYLATFDAARVVHRPLLVSRLGFAPPPALKLCHLRAMCDDTGLFQHAVHSVPDRGHGYCVDDNARALLVACALNRGGEQRMPAALTARFAAFVQHAWNPDTARFRNFMGFDRRWLEEAGSEDCHGRALWALGECSRHDDSLSRRRWAAALFAQALPGVEFFRSPRAWAFTLLGLDSYAASVPDDRSVIRARTLLADRLIACLAATETEAWTWFEDSLAYDNARLSQALIATGLATRSGDYVTAGLRSLRWLMRRQTSPAGQFRPVGSASFGAVRQRPRAFDQQPLEAAAAIAACLQARQADGAGRWCGDAKRAFGWFLGANDLAMPLVDIETGSCRDGLHPDRPNENRGGESVVSYLLALADIRLLAVMEERSAALLPMRAPSPWHANDIVEENRGLLVANAVFEPPGTSSVS